ncbi:MAG: type IV pilus modification protein PilV [Legionellales bacterium]
MMTSKQQGDTLIEILVSLVLFAIGMLGIAGMLLLSNKANDSSYAKQQAVQCVYDIFDRIRANTLAATSGNYIISNINSSGLPTVPSQPAALCNVSVCTPEQLAAYDTWYWLSNDVSKLPRGSGSIMTVSSGAAGNTLITVTVQWDDSPAQSLLGATSATSSSNANWVQLSMQSEL